MARRPRVVVVDAGKPEELPPLSMPKTPPAGGTSALPADTDGIGALRRMEQQVIGSGVAPVVLRNNEQPHDFNAAAAAPEVKTGGLAARIKAARLESLRLGEATDTLNDAFLDVESALSGLRMGVQAEVLMSDDRQEIDDGRLSLAFRKHEGKWALLICEEHPDDPDQVARTPITKASRALRLQAARLLPGLVDMLISNTATQVAEVEGEAAKLVDLATQLRQATP